MEHFRTDIESCLMKPITPAPLVCVYVCWSTVLGLQCGGRQSLLHGVVYGERVNGKGQTTGTYKHTVLLYHTAAATGCLSLLPACRRRYNLTGVWTRALCPFSTVLVQGSIDTD